MAVKSKPPALRVVVDSGAASIRVWARLRDAMVAFDNRFHKAGALTSGQE
jgi:hypothetical protein